VPNAIHARPERARQPAPPFQHQARLWGSQYEANSRQRRSPAGFFCGRAGRAPGGSLLCGSAFDFRDPLFNRIQLRFQYLSLVFQRLSLHFRVRRPIGCGIRSRAHPSRLPGCIKHIAPSAASADEPAPPESAASAETYPEAAPRWGVHIPGNTVTRAVSCCASCSCPHSHGACSISSWHFCTPF